jgi:hypothetical protein
MRPPGSYRSRLKAHGNCIAWSTVVRNDSAILVCNPADRAFRRARSDRRSKGRSWNARFPHEIRGPARSAVTRHSAKNLRSTRMGGRTGTDRAPLIGRGCVHGVRRKRCPARGIPVRPLQAKASTSISRTGSPSSTRTWNTDKVGSRRSSGDLGIDSHECWRSSARSGG